jgi:hypothetical protein
MEVLRLSVAIISSNRDACDSTKFKPTPDIQKVKIICKTAMVCKKLKMHRMHDRRTIRTALAAFKGNIYQKHICSRIGLPHH